MKLCYLLLIFFCISTIGDCAESLFTNEQLTKLFVKGSVQRIEVITPKQGFIGAPLSLVAIDSLPINRGLPKTEEDFDKRYVAIEVVEHRVYAGQIYRIVLRLDETVKEGVRVKKGLYYAYIDVHDAKVTMICKLTDDDRQAQDRGISYGLPFPLTNTIPLPLFATAYQGIDGYFEKENGFGALFTRSINQVDGVTKSESITITTFRDLEKGLIIAAKETQLWGTDNTWLWNEMQRVDREGHILMKCKRL